MLQGLSVARIIVISSVLFKHKVAKMVTIFQIQLITVKLFKKPVNANIISTSDHPLRMNFCWLGGSFLPNDHFRWKHPFFQVCHPVHRDWNIV